MEITSDWHIHSDNSCDEACMRVAELIRRAREQGMQDFGLTDHVHTPFNLPDLAASRREYLANSPSAHFHFGVEVSCVSQWELDEIASGRQAGQTYGLRYGGPPGAAPAIGLSAQDIQTFGIEYVVGGTHWPLYAPLEREAVIRDYQRQNMFLVAHPLVDIVAHPWWWFGHWQDADGRFTTDPWLDDFGRIPRSMHDEFAAAAIEHGTAVEINVLAMLMNPHYRVGFRQQYLEYLAGLQARGVRLSIGSDCHDGHYAVNFVQTARLLESAGIRGEKLWRLPPRGEGAV